MTHGFPPAPPPAGYPHLPPPGPQPPPRRPRMRVAVISASVTLAVYLVAAGVVGAMAYTSQPEEPDGDVALPEEPCTMVTATQLRRLSAEDPRSSMRTAYGGSETDGFTSARCGWYAEFSDGTLGSLSLSFDVHNDPAEAKNRYESRATDYEIIPESESEIENYREITIDDSRELDLGDEGFVVFAEEESTSAEEGEEPQATARVEVRHANANISVRASESVDADNEGSPDLTGDEDTLIAIAEDALASLA